MFLHLYIPNIRNVSKGRTGGNTEVRKKVNDTLKKGINRVISYVSHQVGFAAIHYNTFTISPELEALFTYPSHVTPGYDR